MDCKVLGVFVFLMCSIPAQGEPETKKLAKQGFQGLEFTFPVLGLLANANANSNSRTNNLNLFSQSVVTRTVISTVATVTVPAFRTCTMVPAAAMFSACAGRKRRDVSGEIELPEVQPTPSMKLIFDKTEIVDPKQIAEILHLKDPSNLFASSSNEEAADEVTTQAPLERSFDLTTVLYSSLEDETLAPDQEDSQDSTNSARDGLGVTTETPLLDEAATEATTPDLPSLQDDEKARLGVGGNSRKGSTTTSIIPVTHVVSSFVTATMQTLTVSYAGCSPPGPLPVVTSLCT